MPPTAFSISAVEILPRHPAASRHSFTHSGAAQSGARQMCGVRWSPRDCGILSFVAAGRRIGTAAAVRRTSAKLARRADTPVLVLPVWRVRASAAVGRASAEAAFRPRGVAHCKCRRDDDGAENCDSFHVEENIFRCTSWVNCILPSAEGREISRRQS